MIEFLLNDTLINTHQPPGLVLVDFVRYHRHLMGTKIGCREGDCGACTVLVGELGDEGLQYDSVTSCLMPLANAHGKHIVTVEGINMKAPNMVQQAMCDEGATQCGFCTPGIVMSLAGFCLKGPPTSQNGAPQPTQTERLLAAVDGNICRCTGYKSIERAAMHVGNIVNDMQGEDPIRHLTRLAIFPDYFSGIKERLHKLKFPSEDINVQAGQNNPATHTSINGSAFLGGGTDLYVQQHEMLVHRTSNFMFDRVSLKGIYQHDNKCILGASATVSDILQSGIFQQYFPHLSRYIKLVSSTPIRNMATIAGNFINASPIGDLTIFFLSLNAKIILTDDHSTRELPLQDLYQGYKTLAKRPEEYIKQVWFTLPDKNALFNFEKVSKRTNLDIASVNTAMTITLEDDTIIHARLSAGGVGPIPLFLSETSTFLEGKKLTAYTIQQAIEKAASETSPISDVRGTATYKRLLLKQLIKAHFITLFPNLEVAALLYA
ncbi:MAG: FAD binding domain-containing protein [Chitinophagaceae bacterium]